MKSTNNKHIFHNIIHSKFAFVCISGAWWSDPGRALRFCWDGQGHSGGVYVQTFLRNQHPECRPGCRRQVHKELVRCQIDWTHPVILKMSRCTFAPTHGWWQWCDQRPLPPDKKNGGLESLWRLHLQDCQVWSGKPNHDSITRPFLGGSCLELWMYTSSVIERRFLVV